LQQNPSTPVIVETLRSTAEPKEEAAPAKADDRVPLVWRIFGGTVLSIMALVAVTVYQQFNGGLSDLRSNMGHLDKDVHKELARFSETQAELVKQEMFATTMRRVSDAINELRGDRATLMMVKERLAVTMDAFKNSEDQQKELVREVQQMRELKAAEDERKALQGEVQRLRERLAALEAKPPETKQGRGSAKSPVAPAVHRQGDD
jgi:chromosome segregation ATPase